jgi:hypothetical protein
MGGGGRSLASATVPLPPSGDRDVPRGGVKFPDLPGGIGQVGPRVRLSI